MSVHGTVRPDFFDVHRLAPIRKRAESLLVMGLADDQAKSALATVGVTDEDLDEFLNRPFEIPKKYDPNKRGRFDDKDRPTFYSAQDLKTAEAEVLAHAVGPDRFYRDHVTCAFRGILEDLTGLGLAYLVGTSASDYSACRTFASAAHSRGAQALLTPSARRSGGKCVPVFEKQALSGAALVKSYRVEFVTGSGTPVLMKI